MKAGAVIHPDDRDRAAAAVAEAVDDLGKMLGYCRDQFEAGDEYLAVVISTTRELLASHEWTRLELASVLAVACADLTKDRP